MRKDADVRRLRDLAGKRVYVGSDGSGVLLVAVRILDAVGVEVTDTMRVGTTRDALGEASIKLQQAILNAAFVVGGMPTRAVTDAMESGCCELLDLGADMSTLMEIESFGDTYSDATILASVYPNQDDPIRTISTTAHLIAREDLPDALAGQVVDGLYDNILELLRSHTTAQDIEYRMPHPNVIDLHPGVARFWEQQQEMLLIATGAIDGTYYATGKMIQTLLEQYGIDSRVVHTDGSLENLARLQLGNTLALMQYDVALAAYFGGDSRPIYGLSFPIPEARGLRRIAALHREHVHAIIRRDRLGGGAPTISALDGLRVAVGPENSGSRLLAEAILDDHGLNVSRQVVSVGAMVDQLRAGQIDAGFFTETAPGSALASLLADPLMQLLSVESSANLGGTLTATTIEEGTYRNQLEGEAPIKTIGTQAVLLTTNDPGIDIGQITRAIFEGAAFMGMDAGALALDLPSIPLHPAAKVYYEDNGYRPSQPETFVGLTFADWLDRSLFVGQV